jgi:tetratricopeptide (TPR) repeat protein
MTDEQEFEEALSLKRQKRYAEAQTLLEKLATRVPNSAALYAVLGDVYWEEGFLDKAAAAFHTATLLSPKSETASLGLFHCLWDKGDRDIALLEAKRFLESTDSENYRNILLEVERNQRTIRPGG